MQIECGVVDMHAVLAARWALNVDFYAFLLICQKKHPNLNKNQFSPNFILFAFYLPQNIMTLLHVFFYS